MGVTIFKWINATKSLAIILTIVFIAMLLISINYISNTFNNTEETYAEDLARNYDASVSEDQIASAPSEFTQNLEEGDLSDSLRHGWGITFLVFGIIVFIIGGIYALLFFAFNRFTIKDNKVIRVFALSKINGQVKLVTCDFQIIYRPDSEVFRNKALAAKLIDREP